MVCRICHSKAHNRSTCPLNVSILATRPGKRRCGCKRLSLTSRRIKRLKIFTQPAPNRGRRRTSQNLLQKAKQVVLDEITRLEKLVWADPISSLEHAFFEASGENKLFFNFADMRENVINARFGVKELVPGEDFGHNDGLQVILNKNTPMNEIELQKLLLHEAMHHNVTRVRGGNRALNTEMDHCALALLGDPDEASNFQLGWFNCVFKDCQNARCLDTTWIE